MSTVRIQVRRGTASQWTSVNPILAAGEMGVESDTNLFKFGNGTATWTALAYANNSDVAIGEISQDAINTALSMGAGLTKSYNDGTNTIQITVDSDVVALKSYVDTQISGLSNTVDAGFVPIADLGQPNGVATLNSSSKVPSSQIDTDVIATRAYADQKVSDLVNSAPGALDTLAELSNALSNDANFATTMTNTLATKLDSSEAEATYFTILLAQDKAPLASPTFTGTVGLPSTTSVGTVSGTEIGHLSGVTGGIQSQLDYKAPLDGPTFTGNVILPSTTQIGNVAASELGYLDGASSNIQDQIDYKAPLASPTFTGTVVLPSTTSIGLVGESEIESLNGITSNVQSQLDDKAPLASPTFTGTVGLPSTTSVGTVSGTEIGHLSGVTGGIQSQLDDKASSANALFTGTFTAPNGTITGSMIASGTITSSNILDGAIDTADIADSAITSAKIAAGTIAESNIADSAITSAKIAAGTIVDGDIHATAGIDKTKIAGTAVTLSDLGTVDTAMVADSAITSAKIAAGTIVDGDISSTAAIAQSKVDGLTTDLSAKAPLASPTFTGTVSGITKAMVGLSDVNNTSDLDKPVSTAQATAIADAQAAAIADATSQVSALLAGAPAALNTLDELAAALGDDANFASSVTTSLSAKAPLDSPTFTGTVTVAASGIAFTDGTQSKEGVPSRTPIISKTADYTLSALTERDSLVEMNSASGLTLTIPTDATLNFPIGTSIDILRVGSGSVTVSAATPATTTINYTPGNKLRAQWSSATLFKRAADTWILMGDLTA